MNRHPIFLSDSSASSAATVTRFSPLDHHPRSLARCSPVIFAERASDGKTGQRT
jgi:hypothetical protein